MRHGLPFIGERAPTNQPSDEEKYKIGDAKFATLIGGADCAAQVETLSVRGLLILLR